MTDDRPAPSLRDLAGDLPPLPDDVWERTLAAAFDPHTDVDADLVPDIDDLPVVMGDDEILLDDDGLLPGDDDDPAEHADHHDTAPQLHSGVDNDAPGDEIDLDDLGAAEEPPAHHTESDAAQFDLDPLGEPDDDLL